MQQSSEPSGLTSAMIWKDTLCLDLSPIAKENVGSILQQCTQLGSIIGQDCELNLKTLTENLRRELKSLSLYRVSLNNGLLASPEDTPMTLGEEFSSALQQLTSLEELVLVDLQLGDLDYKFHTSDIVVQLPTTLRRLQLSDRYFYHQIQGPTTPQAFATLDCLIVDDSESAWLSTMPQHRSSGFYANAIPLLLSLRQLRELCLGPMLSRGVLSLAAGADFARELCRLEVLCVDVSSPDANGLLPQLMRSHPTLRILILTGTLPGSDEILIPARGPNPTGVSADSLPRLHVFVGGQIAEKIRFAKSPNDGVDIHPITLPMPAFLEQPEVAAIFKGSWIGEMIRKGAKSDARLWDYDALLTTQSFLDH